MSFHFPLLLWALFVPLVLWLLDFRRRRNASQETSHPKILRAEAGTRHLELTEPDRRSGKVDTANTARIRWRLWLGVALAIVAFARPQWGRVDEPVFDQAREILIALDLSRSMLTPDIKPSRLERGKLLVTSLLERLEGERVGLIVFAGTAFLQSPLSSDYEILNEFLPALSPDFLPEGGTNYKALIETALAAFGSTSSADRFLIVLSDGEATEENWKEAAAELKQHGVRVISLGVGTAEGAIVPDGAGGFVKDERGAVVLSKLEPATLQQLAELTQGTYRDASAWVDLAQLIQSTVDTGKKGAFREQRQVRLVERFQWALAPALLFFLWSFWREFPVYPRSREVKLVGQSSQEKAHSKESRVAGVTVQAVMLSAIFLTAGMSRVRAADAPGTSSAAEPLSALIGQLSARPALRARDYAEIANSTLTYAERIKSAKEAVSEGSIQDALQAVDAGEAIDPKAADWPTLREKLKAELKKDEPPPEQPEQPKNQDQQQDKKDQDKEKKDQPDQQKSDQNKSDEQKSQDKKDEQSKQQDQKQSSDQNQQSNNQKEPQKKSDSSEKNSDQQKQNQDASKAQSAFGEMQKQQDGSQAPQPQPQAQQQPSQGNPETQKVGGAPDKPSPQTPPNPELVVPLQKLEQVRNQDSPVRLQQIMRGDKQTPAKAGKNW